MVRLSVLFAFVVSFPLATSVNAKEPSPKSIGGVVTDDAGQPVAAARVLVLAEAIVDGWYVAPVSRQLAVGTTDANGEFQIPYINPLDAPMRTLTVACIADERPVSWKQLSPVGNSQNLRLTVGRKSQLIRGTVTDENDEPLSDALVNARVISIARTENTSNVNTVLRFDLDSAPVIHARTNAKGQFSLDSIGPEVTSVRIDVSAKGHTPSATRIDTSSPEPTEVRLSNDENSRFVGTLIETQNSISSKNVRLVFASYRSRSFGGVVCAVTDESGRFEVTPFEGDYLSVAMVTGTGKLFWLINRKPRADVRDSMLSLQLPEVLAKSATFKLDTTEYINTRVLVELPSGEPVGTGVLFNSRGEQFSIVDGICNVGAVAINGRTRIYALDASAQHGATSIITIDGRDSHPVRLKPTGCAETQVFGNDSLPLRNTKFSDNPSLDFGLFLCLENGVAYSNQEFGEQVTGLIPAIAFEGSNQSLETNADGRLRIEHLIPDAMYTLSHQENLRLTHEGVPIYPGASLNNVKIISARATNWLPFRVIEGKTTYLSSLSTHPITDKAPNVNRAVFGARWRLDQFAGFNNISHELATLRENLGSCTVRIRGKRGGASGTFISADGIVLTCAHMLDGTGDQVKVVTNTGAEYTATALGLCPELDIALLRLENLIEQKFSFARRSLKEPIAGQWNVIAGYPGNNIDSVLRVAKILEQGQDRIITTGPLLGGDSGGAIFDMSGELIGVNTGGAYFESYHTPIRHVNENLERLNEGEYWRVLFE